MKIKQRTVCPECRTRKLGCDGKAPACTQCQLRGRECPGYQPDFIFIPQKKAAISSLVLWNQYQHIPLVPPSGISAASNLQSTSLEEIISLIAKHYVPEEEISLMSPGIDSSQSRICGCWVEVLPVIVASREKGDVVVSSAIRALCLSILNKDPGKRGLNSDFTEAYCAALALLRKGLPTSYTLLYAEFAAASMCLTLAEVLFPTCEDGWRRHIQGIGHLMQLTGPELHSLGAPFKLFVGFRPLLVTEAFIARKSTFVALGEWIKIPFQFNPASPMQILLSHAAIIPSLLEKSDRLEQFPCNATQSTVNEACAGFKQVLSALLQWEKDQRKQETGPPPYWPRLGLTRSTSASSMPIVSLWFPNILLANAFTHLWTFQVICLIELAKLRSQFSNWACEAPVAIDSELPSQIFEREYIVELSTKICQAMEYQMQDDMKLYGPASTLFPLRTARKTFELDVVRYHEQITWCRGFLDQLRSKGIHWSL